MIRFVVMQLMIMMLSSPVVLASFLTKSSVGGDAYLIRGNGDVIPAAGRTVYLLPVESEVELLYPAFRSAYEKVLDENKAEILGRCGAAKELIVNNKESEKNNLKDLLLRGSIPEGGCKGIEFNLNELLGERQKNTDIYDKDIADLIERIDGLESIKESKVEKISDEFNSRRNDMDSKILNLEKKKMERIGRLVKRAEEDVRDSLVFDVYLEKSKYGPEKELKVYMVNNTDYCVHEVEVRYSVPGVASSVKRYRFDDKKDEFGFSKNCPVLPGETLRINERFYDGEFLVDSPVKKMRVQESGVRTFSFLFENIMVPTEHVIHDYKITTTPKKVRSGDSVSYVVEDVNFEELAISNNKFPQDKEIIKLKEELSVLELEHEELSRATAKDEVEKIDSLKSDLTKLNDEYSENLKKISSEIIKVEDKVLQCDNDNTQKSAIESKINNLEKMDKSIQGCVDGEIDDSVYSSLEKLHSDYPDIIGEIPGVRKGLAGEFIKNVLMGMLISNARSDDISINGSYGFSDVKDGKYLIFSEYNNNFVEGFWMDEVNVSGDSTVDLNTNNFASLGFIDYLRYQSEVGCIDCDKNGFSESLLSKNDASSKYRKNKREIEELQLKLENSMRALDSLLFSY